MKPARESTVPHGILEYATEVTQDRLGRLARTGRALRLARGIYAVDKTSFLRCRGSLKPGGVYIATDLGRFMVESLILILWTSRIGNRRVKMGMPHYTKQDILFLKDLIEAGKYRAVIDRRYPLE